MRRLPLALPVVVLLAGSTARADAPPFSRQTELAPFSIYDASTIGSDRRLAFAFGAGFPYVQAMAAVDVFDGLDVDLNLDSLYGVVEMVSLGPKLRLFHAGGLALAVEVQGQAAFFRESEANEANGQASGGSRLLTGLRNYELQPQLLLSYRGHYGSVFGALIYQGTFDTEPISGGPLVGNPGAWTYGTNLGAHVGFELAAFGVVHPYSVLGLDFHTRDGDAPLMIFAEFGFSFPA